MQNAVLIARERMTALRGHPTALTMSTHDVSLTTFVWALHAEFLPHAGDAHFILDPESMPISDFARTLLLSPEQVASRCRNTRKHQLLALHNGQLRLVFGNLNALADSLLSKAM